MSESNGEFYREYVLEKEQEAISRISKSTAIVMIESSPYLDLLTRFQIQVIDSKVVGMMNKGAVRVTPSERMMEKIMEDVIGPMTDSKVGEKWLDTEWNSMDPYKFGGDYRNQVWVYNHDGRYYITRPIKSTGGTNE